MLSSIVAPLLQPALVTIPAGWFFMGSESGRDNERPIHRIWIDTFLLAACQVTNAEYGRFLRDTGKAPPLFWLDPNFAHPEQPVVGPCWHEATQYCEWLSTSTGEKYRLPTEA
jgi:sulfatase modifying factor 1